MRIGVPKEIKVHEYRVGLVPASVRELIANGHDVFVQHGAAERMGISDDDYRRVGGRWWIARRAYRSHARTGRGEVFPFPRQFEFD